MVVTWWIVVVLRYDTYTIHTSVSLKTCMTALIVVLFASKCVVVQ